MMSFEFDELIAVLSAGVGMLLIGGLNLLVRSRPWRGLASLAAGAAATAAVCASGTDSRACLAVGGVMLLAVAASVLDGSGFLASVSAACSRAFRRPEARWGMFACAGLLAAIGSFVLYEQASAARNNDFLTDIMELDALPPGQVAVASSVVTDRGNPVQVREAIEPRPGHQLQTIEERILNRDSARFRVIRRQPADDRSNCHGWVFAAGRYWIGGAVVPQILLENNYQPVEQAQTGDLAIYRDEEDRVTHTAIVRYVSPGMPVLVEGKWGCTGIYLHAVESSLYGTNVTFYRSPRPGHVLSGLGETCPEASSSSRAR